MRTIVRNGGEGIMLHRPGQRYQPGRVDYLVKLKPDFFHDAIGGVLSHRLKEPI